MKLKKLRVKEFKGFRVEELLKAETLNSMSTPKPINLITPKLNSFGGKYA